MTLAAHNISFSFGRRAVLRSVSADFPAGIQYSIPYNPTEDVAASVEAVQETLLEAIVLVMLVVLVVYWLASTIPVLAISSMDLTDAEGAFRMPTGFIIANLAVGTLVNLFWGLVQASLYVELRDWKDGPATARLEEVFR